MIFSDDYNKLIADPQRFAELMKYNESSPVYTEWEQKRRFIADTITGDGTILDIGCAGGFFLKSLQQWSGHKLVPYGVDIIDDYIRAAKDLFHDQKNNFAVLDVKNIAKIEEVGLPKHFDFVFWNFLGPKYFNDPNLEQTISSIIALANKRVIIGFYRGNPPGATEQQRLEDRKKLKERVDSFAKDWPVSGIEYNPSKFNQAVVWIDK